MQNANSCTGEKMASFSYALALGGHSSLNTSCVLDIFVLVPALGISFRLYNCRSRLDH